MSKNPLSVYAQRFRQTLNSKLNNVPSRVYITLLGLFVACSVTFLGVNTNKVIPSVKICKKATANEQFTNSVLSLQPYVTDTEAIRSMVAHALTYQDSLGKLRNADYKRQRFAEVHGIKAEVTLAVILRESRFNPGCIGGSGEVGLMQILPSTARSICRMFDIEYSYERLKDPGYNIMLGTLYLEYNMDRYNDLSRALVAYNAGRAYCRSNAYSRGVLKNMSLICN